LIIDPIGKREFTYGQLRDLSRAVGRNLQAKLRLQVGERIAIFSPNCPEYIIAVLGIAACGATISPASAGFSANELIYQLETSGSTALITHAALLDTALKAAQATNMPKERIFVIPEAPAATIPGGLTSFDALLSETGGSKLAVPRLNAKKELFALPYSSGTTGRPKGVKLSHFNIVANALQCVSIAAQGEVDVPPSHEVSVSILPFSHIYGTCSCLDHPSTQ
jgi:long-subunit acyl-CoA synthetase (AMP-forming)